MNTELHIRQDQPTYRERALLQLIDGLRDELKSSAIAMNEENDKYIARIEVMERAVKEASEMYNARATEIDALQSELKTAREEIVNQRSTIAGLQNPEAIECGCHYNKIWGGTKWKHWLVRCKEHGEELKAAREQLELHQQALLHAESDADWAKQELAIERQRREEAERVIEAHRRFHGDVGCPGLPDCYVCQQEDAYFAQKGKS